MLDLAKGLANPGFPEADLLLGAKVECSESDLEAGGLIVLFLFGLLLSKRDFCPKDERSSDSLPGLGL